MNACIQLFDLKPGMHHRMQSGSIARAASALPMSSVSQPKASRTAFTSVFADSSLPRNRTLIDAWRDPVRGAILRA